MSFLADTTLLIDYYRKCEVAKKYFDKLESGEISFSISVITEAEIWCGIKNDNELAFWLAMLDLVKVENVDSSIARKAGEIYREFGHYMGKTKETDYRYMGDAFIAATCSVLNKTLITGNYKHFKQLESRGILNCQAYSE